MTAPDSGSEPGPESGPEPGPELVLRPAEVEEVPQLVEIYLAAGTGAGHPTERRSREQLEAWLGERVRRTPPERHEVWVAAAQEAPMGFLDLHGDWVSLLFVHPRAQRQGVGRALLELVQALRPGGFGLLVHADNATARAFYARLGLVELERTDGSAYDDGWPDCRLAWPGQEPLRHWRAAIDEVDAELAVLLARRFALTAAVQDHKAATEGAGGEAARDPQREAEIVERMARLAPSLDRAHLERVMAVVLEQGIAAWEHGPPAD